MSAPAESTMSGGNNHNTTAATPDENSRLDLPKDAVPMESMSSAEDPVAAPANTTALSESEPPKDAGVNDESVKPNPEPVSSSTAAVTSSDPPEPASSTAVVEPASPAKGKEKEGTSPPPPPSKEDSATHDPTMAIGEAVDDITSVAAGSTDAAPVCTITLLLTSGSRHPYKIDAKYLGRRNVKIPDENEHGQPDPFSISVYTLKELILREWRSDWETAPSSPSSIRLIHFGKLLEDKEQLKKYRFSTETPNVVHMSIRPQDLDEEEPKTGGKNTGGSGSDGQRQRSGGCCVVL